jgi:hypothetical protein
VEKNRGYAEALLGYFVIAASAGVIATAFVVFVLANLLIAHRVSLDHRLGVRIFRSARQSHFSGA